MESEIMLTPREQSPVPEKFSSEEGRNQDATSSRTANPTHYQQAIPTPNNWLKTALLAKIRFLLQRQDDLDLWK